LSKLYRLFWREYYSSHGVLSTGVHPVLFSRENPFDLIKSRTYLVSAPIVALYYTELVGDARVPPTLKATAGFAGIAVIGA
jgi:hypothetical protein